YMFVVCTWVIGTYAYMYIYADKVKACSSFRLDRICIRWVLCCSCFFFESIPMCECPSLFALCTRVAARANGVTRMDLLISSVVQCGRVSPYWRKSLTHSALVLEF